VPNLEFPLPVVESGKVYAPGTLAREIRNLQRTNQDTLRSVRGPAPLVPDYGSGYPSQYDHMFGVVHARLARGGTRDCLLVRTGDKLIEQRGWSRDFRTLRTGLSPDVNGRYPDQFCVVNGRIVWTNGIDRALVYDGFTLLNLGYREVPSAPTVLGPGNDAHPVFTNDSGYAHPGAIGTVGDVFNTDEGTLLPGAWYYAVQFEDEFGNKSAWGPLGGPALIRTERTAGYYWIDYTAYPDNPGFLGLGEPKPLGTLSVTLDDLTRQFFLEGIPVGPSGTVKRHIGRTMDATRNPNTIRRLVTIDDNITTSIPDNFPDAALGPEVEDIIPVPTFQVMCAHQGSLWIGAGSRVYRSQPGFIGTFERDAWVDLDGEEVTALASWAGHVIAATERTIYLILDDAEGIRKRPLSEADGCTAPNSMQTTGLGLLVWLSSNGFRAMDTSLQIQDIFDDEQDLLSTFSRGLMGRAQAEWCSTTKEYLCAVPLAGEPGNNLVLAFDGRGWRRLLYGIRWGGICETRDWTRRLIGVGLDTAAGQHNVFDLTGEHASYTPPEKTYLFRTQWLRPDMMGRKRFSSCTVWLGIVETGNFDITCRVYQNWRMANVVETKTFTAAVKLPAQLSAMVVGTDSVIRPRMTWKRVDFRIKSCESISFDFTCVEPNYLHIHAISLEFTQEDAGDMASRA
jgi:hypothetical protein